MSNSFRLDQIYTLLLHKERLTVEELAQTFKVTPTTIRRDLLVLEERNLIHRTRGAVMLSQDPRRTTNFLLDEKKRIAAAASRFLSDTMSVILDSGTTVAAFVDYILESNNFDKINFITHSPQTALRVSAKYAVSLPSGCLMPQSDYIVSYDVENFYRSVNVDLAVLSSTGVHDCPGLTISFPLQLNVKKSAAECANKRIALLDSSKYFRRGIYVFCDFQDIDTLVTVETEENKPQLDRISKLGTDIILA